MTTIESLMKVSEMRELSKLPLTMYHLVNNIIHKPFKAVNIGDLEDLTKTDVFDYSFPDLLLSELLKRYYENGKS